MRRRPPEPGPVYALADLGLLGTDRFVPAVETLARAGIRWIQLRTKKVADRELYRLVDDCFAAVEETDCRLWMDDRADLAALFPFAGLHLGQRDLPPRAARRVLGQEIWIGASSHNEEELTAAVEDPAVDVVAVGPIFPTTSKENPDPVVGLDFLRRARRATDKTLVAIGGIGPENLAAVLAAGADTAAVLGAVCAGDAAANARRLLAAAGGRR